MPTWADAVRSIGEDGALVSASAAILWLAVGYLVLFGVVVIAKPARARLFLSGFAQTTRANMVEAGLRLLVGLAFVGASNQTKYPSISVVIGLFLAVSALLMLLLPGLHRRFASRSTASLFGVFPLFGLASLMLAAALAWFII